MLSEGNCVVTIDLDSVLLRSNRFDVEISENPESEYSKLEIENKIAFYQEFFRILLKNHQSIGLIHFAASPNFCENISLSAQIVFEALRRAGQEIDSK